MSVQLGARFAFKPANVAALRPLEVMGMVREVLRDSDELAEIRARVDHDFGRPRHLSVEVLIAACVAAAATNQSNMHIRGVAALLRALPVSDQRVLGVRWTDPDGGGEDLISERQVAYLFSQVAAAFHQPDARHNHLFVLDDEVWTPDGEHAGLLADVPEDRRDALDCTDTCPLGISMQQLGNRMLTAFWTYTGLPDSDSYAIDSSVVETHFAAKSYGSVADIAKDYVAEEDKDKVGSFRDGQMTKIQKTKGGPITKQTREHVDTLRQEWVTQPKPARDPRSRTPAPVGPVVYGDFHRDNPNFPQIGADGRLVHTKDPGARATYRGAGSSRPSQITNGRDQHSLVPSGLLPDGSPFPPFNRAYNATAGGHDKADSIITLLRQAVDLGVEPGTVTADRIYTYMPAEKFARIADYECWTLVRDLKEIQRKPQQWAAGINYEDGWWVTSGMPPGLSGLPRWPMVSTKEVRTQHHEAFDKRRPFTFRIHSRLADGGFRLRGPAIPDQVTVDEVTGQATSVRGVRVRCPNSPYFHLIPRTVPQTTCTKGQPCGCSKTLTVHAHEIPNSCEPLIWGTTAWAREYARRNLSEASFSLDEYHYGRTKDSIRVRAHKWDFAFAMLTLANFIRTFHSWVMRLGAHALDPGYYSALDPAVFTVAVARVLTPARTTSPRTAAPPGS